MTVHILIGDCIDHLRQVPDASVDSIVTDPPYGLKFMGKAWDHSVPSVDVWRECLRVLKPGGHLLSFFGTRTYHRGVMNIEDAGFEIRDQIGWAYGSGFPKSHDVSKGIDAKLGATRVLTDKPKPGHAGFVGRGESSVQSLKGTMGGEGGFARPWMDDPEAVSRYHMQTAPGSPEVAQWEGWGTALKPAWEPIVVARKPLIGTVAENVLVHGTGALNIDGCRVETDENLSGGAGDFVQPEGRWPANLIHDGSDEVLACFPQAPGQIADVSSSSDSRRTKNVYGTMRRGRGDEPSANSNNEGNVGFKMKPGARRLDSGSAARFFYCAKASKSDRGEGNNHPTVKPTDLMAYLCRLVTPPGGTVLDPFAGSGSTGIAAIREGFSAILIELNPAYAEIARARLHSEAPLFAGGEK